MSSLRPFILLAVLTALVLPGCAAPSQTVKPEHVSFKTTVEKPVRAGEPFAVAFTIKNFDGPAINSLQVAVPEADEVKAADGKAKAAGKTVIFETARLDKGAEFSGRLLVRVDAPGVKHLKIVCSVKTDVWQGLDPYSAAVTVEDTERMKQRRADREEVQKIKDEIKTVTLQFEEQKALADSARAVMEGHEGRIKVLTDTLKNLEEAQARSPQTKEYGENIALYTEDIAWSRRQTEQYKREVDGYEREIAALSQQLAALADRGKALETALK